MLFAAPVRLAHIARFSDDDARTPLTVTISCRQIQLVIMIDVSTLCTQRAVFNDCTQK